MPEKSGAIVLCREMTVILVNKVVDEERITGKERGLWGRGTRGSHVCT
jgi:hypothetical protein